MKQAKQSKAATIFLSASLLALAVSQANAGEAAKIEVTDIHIIQKTNIIMRQLILV